MNVVETDLLPHRCEVLIIGSGAGGATTAAELAEAGFDVVVVEEGEWIPQGEVAPFSLEQMSRQYRSGGVTVALGRPGIAYTEEEASGWLNGEGFSVTARYGVRAFADCVPAARLEDATFFDALLDLELAAASLTPYRSMARYVHLIANKEVEIS